MASMRFVISSAKLSCHEPLLRDGVEASSGSEGLVSGMICVLTGVTVVSIPSRYLVLSAMVPIQALVEDSASGEGVLIDDGMMIISRYCGMNMAGGSAGLYRGEIAIDRRLD